MNKSKSFAEKYKTMSCSDYANGLISDAKTRYLQYPQKVSERGPCFGLFYIESYGGGYLARTGKSGSNMIC
ncbi:hypothetical protein OUZ56_023891 [Daphnia magna]|uniref:Uncharacterized protein n=1 Tax=Daphnia magna TaxID=35525 RepID=A0ABR0AZQ8_9CRUS|nr:hypothetical protein OUZ56_023891 [Daphnia magna]